MSRILVTGATGFVGRHLSNVLLSEGHEVLGTTRKDTGATSETDLRLTTIPDIGDYVDWAPALQDVDSVVHLAARVHVMKESAEDPLATYRRTNVAGTENLLRRAGKHGIKRFVFISTVKVHGDATYGTPYSTADTLAPTDPYGCSKLEAEELVKRIGAEDGIETVIIRPPLVYGPGVAGNFLRLLRLVDKGIPLPFGLVENVRSLVGVDNLCDLIRECLTNHSAVGKRFLVSDNSDVSTRELVGHIATAMSKRARILPVPPRMISLAAKLVGKSAEASRLLDSLQVDISDTMQTLNWKPPVSLEDGVRSTVRWHREKTCHDQ